MMNMDTDNLSQEPVDKKAEILSGFQQYVLEHGTVPPSVFKLAKALKMTEQEFYDYFTSFEAVKSAIWLEIFDATVEDLFQQEIYHEYSAREKLLAFLFTWMEALKKNRSYLLVLYESPKLHKMPPPEVREFKSKFKEFMSEILEEGKETEEIVKRPFIASRYDEGLWLQVWFIFQFWLKDTSLSFEKTDALIEKSVHLAFDLMGKSTLDSMADFAKFLYQNK